MNRFVYASGLLLLLSGCVSSPIVETQTSRSEIIDYPQVGVRTSSGLGERLVAKGVRTIGPAIEIKRPTQFNKAAGDSSVMTCALTVQPATVFQRGVWRSKTTADCFGPVSAYATLADGSTNWNCPGRQVFVDICSDGPKSFFMASMSTRIPLKQDFDNIQRTTGMIESNTNFIQELLYNGRVDNHLKFVYREFSDDIIRPAFTQEVQYDFDKSNEIGFKNMRIEVFDATNTSITYQLLNNF